MLTNHTLKRTEYFATLGQLDTITERLLCVQIHNILIRQLAEIEHDEILHSPDQS